MKIVVVGATGATGLEVVSQALQAGDQVTAFVRQVGKLPVEDKNLTVVIGDPTTDVDALAAALEGSDALISTLGNRGMGASDVITKSSRVFVEAAQKAGMSRVIIESAFGLNESAPLASGLYRFLGRTMLSNVLADKRAGESIITSSDLDWTFAYPTILTDTPLTAQYSATDLASTKKIPGLNRIPRADVAHFLLREAREHRFSRQVVVVNS